MRISCLVVMVALSAGAEAKEPEYIDPGPKPEWSHFTSAAEEALKVPMFDPDSAQIQWPYGLAGGYWKPVLSRKVAGWYTCGRINGRNRYGGYVGFRAFVAVMKNDQIVYSDASDGGNYDFTDIGCAKAVKQGLLSPPPIALEAAKSRAPDNASFGLSYSIVPDGLYIARVEPGGLADSVGLKQGMVISHLNGNALKGLSETIVKSMLSAAGNSASLTVIGQPKSINLGVVG